jgi:hypothetical protein
MMSADGIRFANLHCNSITSIYSPIIYISRVILTVVRAVGSTRGIKTER